MTCDGFFTFDRQAALIDHLDLNRTESRQPGPVEAGLDHKSTLTVSRQAAEPPKTLTDTSLAAVSLQSTPERELLLLHLPGGTATLLHDRNWDKFWEDRKLIVLKRLSGSQVIAQCNLMVGPPAGKGRHQDPAQFRADIRRGLKQRFVRFIGAGEVDGHPAGGFRYKVAVLGREGQLGIVWYYYLLGQPRRRTAPGHIYSGPRARGSLRRQGPRNDWLARLAPKKAARAPVAGLTDRLRGLACGAKNEREGGDRADAPVSRPGRRNDRVIARCAVPRITDIVV